MRGCQVKMLRSSILTCVVREAQAWFMKNGVWVSPWRTVQELVCLSSFFLDMGKKVILLKASRGFSGPGHHQQTWHKGEALQMAAGGCCLHPASPFLPAGGRVSSKSPSCSSLKQERFPGHCPELNSLGSDKKKTQSGLQFYLPLKLAILKKHITLDFWPDILFFFFLNCHYLLQLISPNKQEIHYSWQSNSEVQTRLYGCSGCTLWGGKGLLSLLSITAFGLRHVGNNPLALS